MKNYFRELTFSLTNEDIQIALQDDNTCVSFKFHHEYEATVSIDTLKDIHEAIEEILEEIQYSNFNSSLDKS